MFCLVNAASYAIICKTVTQWPSLYPYRLFFLSWLLLLLHVLYFLLFMNYSNLRINEDCHWEFTAKNLFSWKVYNELESWVYRRQDNLQQATYSGCTHVVRSNKGMQKCPLGFACPLCIVKDLHTTNFRGKSLKRPLE